MLGGNEMKYIPKHTTAEYLAWIDSNVESARKLLSPLGGTDDVTTYVLVSSTASLLANRDVLVNKESGLPENGAYLYEYQRSWDDGYNTCLAELRAKIASKLDEVM